MAAIHRRVEIVNSSGLHLRAACQLVHLARRFQADVQVRRDGTAVDGKSVLDLTTLAAECGTWLDLEASGPDAEAAIVALCALIASGFGKIDGD
jgi:phosphocarrier protein